MKKAINFRLDNPTLALLNSLSKELDMTKTAVVEASIRALNKSKMIIQKEQKKHELAKYAGTIDDATAKEWLEIVQKGRRYKKAAITV